MHTWLMWRFPYLLVVGLSLYSCSGWSLAAEEVTAKNPPISKVLKMDNEQDAAEIRKVIETDLPKGYILEVDYVFWIDGSQIPRGYAPTRATPKDAEGNVDGTVRLGIPGGPTRTIQYVKGRKQGVEKAFRTFGRLHMECTWEDDNLHGLKKTYHDNGNVMSETKYEHGQPVGESHTYDPAGKLLEVTPYKDGLMDGDRIQYWPGNEKALKRIAPYRNGMVHGLVREFREDGSNRKSIQFAHGDPHGIEIEYDEKGVETRRRYWLKGDVVPRGKFEAEYKEDESETQEKQ